MQEKARAILVAGAPAPLPQHVMDLQERLLGRLLGTGAVGCRLYVLEIAGPIPRVKIGRSQNFWKRVNDHLREMNRYQYGLVDAHLTERLSDRAIERAEAKAHGWMSERYRSITKEEYANADYGFAVTCADAAAGLYRTHPARKLPPA
ncbi:hypothetical protein [Streptomyces sp. NPDC002215]|uniref:hypothetical protein n=1 Tax=Streptomyces sp. NPDC002215 TaxID=3154412 RepID=UPI00331B5566